MDDEQDELEEGLERYLPLNFVRDELSWALANFKGARMNRKLNLLAFRAEGIMLDGQKPRQRKRVGRDHVRLRNGKLVSLLEPMLIGPLTPQHRITTPMELDDASRAKWESTFREILSEGNHEQAADTPQPAA